MLSSIVWEHMTDNSLRCVAMATKDSRDGGAYFMRIGRVEMIGSSTLVVPIQGNGPGHRTGEAVTSNAFAGVAVLSPLSWCSSTDLSSIGRVEMVGCTWIPVAIEGNGSFHLLAVDETLYAFRCVAMITNAARIGSSNLVDICGVEMIRTRRFPVPIEGNQTCVEIKPASIKYTSIATVITETNFNKKNCMIHIRGQHSE